MTFLLDECLSAPIAKVLNHCSKKHDPPFAVESLSPEDRGKADLEWLAPKLQSGRVVITSDAKMINEHSVVTYVADFNGKLFILDRRASQRNRWALLRWFVTHLPKLREVAESSTPGSTWLVNAKGRAKLLERQNPKT